MNLESFKTRYPEFELYSSSFRNFRDKGCFLVKREEERFVVIGKEEFKFYPVNQDTANLLCENFSYLRPRACGLKNSFGFGDRIGLATAGHIRALKDYDFFPIFAQQSVREIERTGRNFKEVLNSAILGCFQEGYKRGFGADADHIRDLNHLDEAIEAGFTFFTIDPSDKIKEPSKITEEEKKSILNKKFEKYEKSYLGKVYQLWKNRFEFDEKNLSDIILVYVEAVDFVEDCYNLVKSKAPSFDFEVSIDETPYPTTPLAHIFIVEELRRRKIDFHSLALRFPGRFEKGIDYRGGLEEFTETLRIHQRIREKFGPYKISLHSGSDKFKIYPIFKEILRENFHVKTSGTSWIEAVKLIAESDFDFFLEILNLAVGNFQENSSSYEICANPELINFKKIKKENIKEVFNDENLRQIIHISYGSVLSETHFRDRFYKILNENEERYRELLDEHLKEHLKLLS